MPPELLAAIEAIASLPGIGRRSAMRIAFELIKAGPLKVRNFTSAIANLSAGVTTCERCGAYVSNSHPDTKGKCQFCDSGRRSQHSICVVENPWDVYAVENTGEHQGLYHVLGGVLSPLDGIGPDELKIRELRERARRAQGGRFDVREFHGQVLDTGALPLAVLEDKLRRWIDARPA